jgi:uncharacterized protein (DUF983 family)
VNLDPEATGDRDGPGAALVREASGATVLTRGARKRCPRCGERRIWSGWFELRSVCPGCSLRFEKEEGGFLGAMVLNYMVAFGVWLVVIGVTLVLTVPHVPVPQLMAMSVVALVGTPLWFYPRSKTIWAAIEFLVHRSEPGYTTPVRRDTRTGRLE